MTEPAPQVLRKDDIQQYLLEVAEELGARGLSGTLVVVGGSYMA